MEIWYLQASFNAKSAIATVAEEVRSAYLLVVNRFYPANRAAPFFVKPQ